MSKLIKVIQFSSNEEYFEKEKSGIKNNTFRKIDYGDLRFIELIKFSKGKIKNLDIKIVCNKSESILTDYFFREIKDVSIYDGYMIITWKHCQDVEYTF